jgi:ech hydrogenase subunit F
MFMTKTILRNLFSKKTTRLYPTVQRPDFEGSRGELYNDIEKCTFCKICAIKCPANCLKVDSKEGIWELDIMTCVYCGLCVDVCPPKCLSMKPAFRQPFVGHQTQTLRGTPRAAKRAAKSDDPPAQGSDTPV